MKNLSMLIHDDVKQSLADALRDMPEVTGFTLTPVESHGSQDARDVMLSARDRVVGFTPHVRVDMILNDIDVGKVIEALRTNNCGAAGRCNYWITPVEEIGKL
ncbi:MAG: DUF3240 family protein [Nitrospirota bacterium]